MKKRYVLGSAIVVLLMLVTTQTMFMENVISWPSEHTGDADVGDMWVTELNTTSIFTSIKNVSIGHANATHDWVKWTTGIGTVKADWSVDIGDKHPEYWIRFYLSVFNIDDNSTELCNTSFRKEYSANTSYTESGTLSVIVELSPSFVASNTNATLFCLLDATATINDTNEAVNFTSWSQDRCVVGISLDSEETNEPFSRFTIEANEECPHSWSYFDGWNESGRFDDEEDMLNNQTHFMNVNCSSPEITGDWRLGYITITIHANDDARAGRFYKDEGEKEVDVDNNGFFTVSPYIDVTVVRNGGNLRGINVRWNALAELPLPVNGFGSTFCPVGETTPVTYRWNKNFDLWDVNNDEEIWIPVGWIYPKIQKSWGQWFFNFNIEKLGVGTPDQPVANNHYWESSCVYQNGSINFGVSSSSASSITTVKVNLTSMLQSQLSGETFYTFSGDRGDTRIEVTI
ncbi:MAG: hypothetical protein JSU91_06100 [Thermoplasmatales archaeon]|nr:MAG: hypothetical protein JSU91_06100 [Thermoplasmatales archaeon]